MKVTTIALWLLIAVSALLLFPSCESGGYYRHASYRFGGGVGWGNYYGGPGWGYYPRYPVRPPDIDIDIPEPDMPVATPLPSMGMPDMGGGDFGDFGDFD
jgi:hypothetical protein